MQFINQIHFTYKIGLRFAEMALRNQLIIFYDDNLRINFHIISKHRYHSGQLAVFRISYIHN